MRSAPSMDRGRTVVPDELRLSKAGARAEHGDRRPFVRLAFIDDKDVVRDRQRGHRVADRHEIVQDLQGGRPLCGGGGTAGLSLSVRRLSGRTSSLQSRQMQR